MATKNYIIQIKPKAKLIKQNYIISGYEMFV